MTWFGYVNFLTGFGSFLMPSLTPIAVLYAAVPAAGALIGLFSIEKLVNGLIRGFPDPAGDVAASGGAERLPEAAER
jgi:TRAP-type C4-dicarboxylate transport system permease small subunit